MWFKNGPANLKGLKISNGYSVFSMHVGDLASKRHDHMLLQYAEDVIIVFLLDINCDSEVNRKIVSQIGEDQ